MPYDHIFTFLYLTLKRNLYFSHFRSGSYY